PGSPDKKECNGLEGRHTMDRNSPVISEKSSTVGLQAWKADTPSAGVEGPGSNAPLNEPQAQRADTPWIETAFINHAPPLVCQPFGLRALSVASDRWFTPPA
ncbi:MAG: hypothetical protein ACKN85_17315, partial [Pirellula sp.]